MATGMPAAFQQATYVGRPWAEVEQGLLAQGIPCQTEITRPTRDFFKVDERCLYVVRERRLADGTLGLVLAARLLFPA